MADTEEVSIDSRQFRLSLPISISLEKGTVFQPSRETIFLRVKQKQLVEVSTKLFALDFLSIAKSRVFLAAVFLSYYAVHSTGRKLRQTLDIVGRCRLSATQASLKTLELAHHAVSLVFFFSGICCCLILFSLNSLVSRWLTLV